jgi:cell division septum initiation protein DivIVA
MPDQSSASTEHAIMQEITAPLSTLPEDPVPVASDVDFPIVLRGYDRIAVDAYVKKTSQLVAELQATRTPEAAVRRALERVGEEVSGILQRAHDTASQITVQSRSEAEDRLEAARREATDITTEAADRVKELDLETDRIWEERLRIVEDARDLARQLLALADSAAQRFPAEETASTESVPPGVAEVFAAAAAQETPVEEEAVDEAVEEQPAPEAAAEPEPVAADEPPAGAEAEDPDRTATIIMPPIRPSEPGEQSH